MRAMSSAWTSPNHVAKPFQIQKTNFLEPLVLAKQNEVRLDYSGGSAALTDVTLVPALLSLYDGLGILLF